MTQATRQEQVKGSGSSGEGEVSFAKGLLEAPGGGGQTPESLGNLDFIPETCSAIERCSLTVAGE